jgi:hypothetical protein
VIKAIHEAHAQTGTSFLTGFTEPIEPKQLDGIDIAPVFLQRCVDKIADYRVTVIGSRVFAARLLTPAGAPVDVRATHRSLSVSQNASQRGTGPGSATIRPTHPLEVA